MIGYYKKDLYLYKKMFVIAAITFGMLLVFGLAFRFAYDYGNLAKCNPGDLAMGKADCESLFPFLAGFVIAGELFFLPVKTIDADRASHFYAFAYTTVHAEKRQAVAKVLELLTVYGVALLATGIYGVVFGILFGFHDVKTGMWLAVIACTLMLFQVAVAIPLTYRMKKSDTAMGVILIAIIAALYAGVGAMVYFEKHGSFLSKQAAKLFLWMQGEVEVDLAGYMHAHAGWLLMGIIVICLVSAGIAYVGTNQMLKRRERLCGVS